MSQNLSIRRAWWASAGMFLLHGLIVATWVSRIPAIQARLNLVSGVLGLDMLFASCGAVLAIPACGWLATRFGSAPVTLWSAVGFTLALFPLSIATSATTLALCLFVFGAMAGTMDVAMNVQAIEVEKALGKPTMSRFHAMFSIGGMAGAGLGGLVASRGVPPKAHFAVAALVFAALVSLCGAGLIDTHGDVPRTGHRLPFREMPPGLVAVCAIAFCMLLSEGAMADWTAIYLKGTLGAGPGLAAAGYSVFSAAMAVFRLIGDAVTAWLGDVRTVRFASLVAAAGILLAIAARSPEWALPGFAAAGAGFSVIVPLAYGAGGRVPGIAPGAGVATVTGIGYAGFLIGPPAIGFTAQLASMRWALGIVVAFCLVSASLAGWIGDRDPAALRR